MTVPRVPVLTAAEAAAWDTSARERAAIPSRVLMEAAGRAAAVTLAREFRDELGRGALLVAGAGNNGGDGWVIARALHAVGVPVRAVEVPKDRSPDCEANRALALADGIPLCDPEAPWPSAGVVIDALLGTGAGGAPREPLAGFAQRIATHGAAIVAVDGPTGLDLTTGDLHGPVRAELTVTFGGVRRGHLLRRDVVGRVVAVDIGFPPPDPAWPVLVTDHWARSTLPPFTPTMHKGDRGRVLIIGGAAGMAGAAMHVARAAFACGAGLVKLALEADSVAAAQTNFPDALTVTTRLGPAVEPELREALAWADAIVLGPGLGRGADRTAFVHAVIDACATPMVIDADALHVPAAATRGPAARVLTPHPGEFAAQFPDLAEVERFEAPARARDRCPTDTAVLLKGVPTVIADSAGTRVVAAGNPALATGGSGDLLAGCIATFLARGVSPGDAAALGAQAMGRAAENAAAFQTVRATRPEDVAAAFPDLWREWAEPAPPRPPELVALDPPAVE